MTKTKVPEISNRRKAIWTFSALIAAIVVIQHVVVAYWSPSWFILDWMKALVVYGVFGLVAFSILISAFANWSIRTRRELRLPLVILSLAGLIALTFLWLCHKRETVPVLFSAYYDGDINGLGIGLRTDGTYKASDASVLGGDDLYGTYELCDDTIYLLTADYRLDDEVWRFSKRMVIGTDGFVHMADPLHPHDSIFNMRVTLDARKNRTPVLLDPPATDPTGDWILVEFHDSIQAHERIGTYRRPPPVWSALLLRVGPDSVDRYGSLRPHARDSRASAGDTLLQLNDYASMTFVHDALNDRILVHWTDAERPERHGTLHYRRLLHSESSLTDHLDQRFGFQKNYHSYLMRTLFAGNYVPLDTGKPFSISDNGAISGHPTWHEFSFHDYFGTLHPYANDMDALHFGTADTSYAFNWQFSGDTLILRPLGNNGDEYWLEPGEVRYLKR